MPDDEWWTFRRSVLAAAALAFGYSALATSTFWIADNGEAAFFPAAGLTLAVLLVVPLRRWGLMIAIIFAAEFGLDLLHGMPVGAALMLAFANSVEPVIAATIICRTGAGLRHETPGDIHRYALAGLASTATSGVIGGAGITMMAGGAWVHKALVWQTGDALGQFIVVPLVLCALGVIPRFQRGRSPLEMPTLLGLVFVTSLVAFSDLQAGLHYLLIPALAVMAIRFSNWGVSLAGVPVAGIAVYFTAQGVGPFSDVSATASGALILTQTFVIVTLMSAHLLGAEVWVRSRLESTLRERERRLGTLVEHAPLPIIEVHPETGVVLSWNPASERMFGWTAEEVIGLDLPIVPDDQLQLRTAYRRAVADEHLGTTIEATRLRKDGSHVQVSISAAAVVDDAGVPTRIVGMFQDISRQKEVEAELVERAHTDPLTLLANRAGLVARIEAAVDAARHNGSTLAVLFCDLDGFKAINDHLGHDAGDRLLVILAKRVTGVVRQTDLVARFGGDEFVIVAPNLDDASVAYELASRVTDAVSEPVRLGSEFVTPAISVGVALFDSSIFADAGELLRAADRAMFENKRDQRRSCAPL